MMSHANVLKTYLKNNTYLKEIYIHIHIHACACKYVQIRLCSFPSRSILQGFFHGAKVLKCSLEIVPGNLEEFANLVGQSCVTNEATIASLLGLLHSQDREGK